MFYLSSVEVFESVVVGLVGFWNTMQHYCLLEDFLLISLNIWCSGYPYVLKFARYLFSPQRIEMYFWLSQTYRMCRRCEHFYSLFFKVSKFIGIQDTNTSARSTWYFTLNKLLRISLSGLFFWGKCRRQHTGNTISQRCVYSKTLLAREGGSNR